MIHKANNRFIDSKLNKTIGTIHCSWLPCIRGTPASVSLVY